MSARARSTPRRSRKFYVSVVLLILIGIAVSGGLIWYKFPKEVHIYVYAPAITSSGSVTIRFNGEEIFTKSYPHSTNSPANPPERDYIKASTSGTEFTVRVTSGTLDETRNLSIFHGDVLEISFDGTIIISQGKTKPF
jgi:uncharacterized membrane protein